MALSGHVVGLLKEYMRDLVTQAEQEAIAHASFGFSSAPYRADQALSDLLALLDDRIESEVFRSACRKDSSTRCGPCVTRSKRQYESRSGWKQTAVISLPRKPAREN